MFFPHIPQCPALITEQTTAKVGENAHFPQADFQQAQAKALAKTADGVSFIQGFIHTAQKEGCT